jgi:hypothetical protein
MAALNQILTTKTYTPEQKIHIKENIDTGMCSVIVRMMKELGPKKMNALVGRLTSNSSQATSFDKKILWSYFISQYIDNQHKDKVPCNQLKSALNEYFKNGETDGRLRIGNASHACLIIVENGGWSFYDPNYIPLEPHTFENIDALVAEVHERIGHGLAIIPDNTLNQSLSLEAEHLQPFLNDGGLFHVLRYETLDNLLTEVLEKATLEHLLIVDRGKPAWAKGLRNEKSRQAVINIITTALSEKSPEEIATKLYSTFNARTSDAFKLQVKTALESIEVKPEFITKLIDKFPDNLTNETANTEEIISEANEVLNSRKELETKEAISDIGKKGSGSLYLFESYSATTCLDS